MPARLHARYTRDTALTQTAPARWHGQQQASISIERYHYLCASIQQAYTVIGPATRRNIVFPSYTAYPLTPLGDVKLHPREDGTIHPGNVDAYVAQFRADWQCREGGVMYCIVEQHEWFDLILNYHSSARTTGMKQWDRLFQRLKRNNFEKGLVPCMFFARESGCLDTECPFLHDEARCRWDREKVLEARRRVLGRPTGRDISLRTIRELAAAHARQPLAVVRSRTGVHSRTIGDSDDDDDDPDAARIHEESRHIKNICANPKCLAVRMRGQSREELELKVCTGCHATYYCSHDCQRADWKRHKKEPCIPFEEIVEDGNYWDALGMRVGTGDVRSRFTGS
ncbi:hypothetical protein FA95DRAFT_531147 [Auriscalpium vulgare]|uniref:Uncharacterized protein n=1 Tax=Auriscalpium vulgare TaxID=40419 RepID=A0ACB8RFJ3_9AGAM|nr:hypothetical protein FA95DRAFT_531147 [Auriscalpium vulgare]